MPLWWIVAGMAGVVILAVVALFVWLAIGVVQSMNRRDH